jgi:branched-chain amino acid transport system ATP-binding protein
MLEVSELRVRYGAVNAVRGVSLDCYPGEIVSIVGPNGAGKSTTLGAVSGALQGAVADGSVTLDGQQLLGQRPERIAKRGLVLVPEGRRVFTSLTVRENLHMGAEAREERKEIESAIDECFELFPILREFQSRRAGLLSGGQQQMLAIARAMMAAPSYVLLDEPTLGLAPQLIDLVFDAVTTIAARGVGVVLVEQHAKRAVAISSRSHILMNGRFRTGSEPPSAGLWTGPAAKGTPQGGTS